MKVFSYLKQHGNIQGGVATNEAIPLLQQAQNSVLSCMVLDACELVEKLGKRIEDDLNTQAGVFTDEIEQKVKDRTDALISMIDDREENLRKLDSFIKQLTDAKKRIQEAD